MEVPARLAVTLVAILMSSLPMAANASHEFTCDPGQEAYYPPTGSGDEGHLYCEDAGTGATITEATDNSNASDCWALGTASDGELCASTSIGGTTVPVTRCQADPLAHGTDTTRDRDCFEIAWDGGASTDAPSSGSLTLRLPRTTDGQTEAGSDHAPAVECEWYLLNVRVSGASPLGVHEDVPAPDFPWAVAEHGPPYGCSAEGRPHRVMHGPEDVYDAAGNTISSGDGTDEQYHMAKAIISARELSVCVENECSVSDECEAFLQTITPGTLISQANECMESHFPDDDPADDGVTVENEAVWMTWSFHFDSLGDSP